jgi:hypothetical protein
MRFYEIQKQLNEVNMSPQALHSWFTSPATHGMKLGFEAEIAIPIPKNIKDKMPEPNSIEAIADFFATDDNHRQYIINHLTEMHDIWATDLFLQYTDDNDDYYDELHARIINNLVKEYGKAEAKRIVKDESTEFDTAYDNAENEIELEFKTYGSGSESSWLIDALNVNNMIDALELDMPDPKYKLKFNTNTDPINDVISHFKKFMGLSVVQYNTYHGTGRDKLSYDEWIVEPDASIKPSEGDFGLEFISPARPLTESINTMINFFKWAKKNNCYTNRSTGLHLNVSVPGYSLDNLDYIKLALFLGDRYVLSTFERSFNIYCKSSMDEIIKAKTPNSNVFDLMKQNLNKEAGKLIYKSNSDKHVSINAKDGWVEFRAPGGDYLNKNPSFLSDTAIRVAMALHIACNDNLYKQEYSKKLYKLASNDNATAVDLFVKYSNNKLSKSELLQNLRKVRITNQDVSPEL